MNAVRCWLRIPLWPNHSIRSKPTRGTREHLWARNANSTLVFAAAMGMLWLSVAPLVSGLVAEMFGTRYARYLAGFRHLFVVSAPIRQKAGFRPGQS